MKNLLEISINAFNQGSDNFGETPTGVVKSLVYHIPNDKTMYFGSPNAKTHKFYSCNIELNEGSAGVGFYVKNDIMEVMSGHIVFSIPVTAEIQAELDIAEVSEW